MFLNAAVCRRSVCDHPLYNVLILSCGCMAEFAGVRHVAGVIEVRSSASKLWTGQHCGAVLEVETRSRQPV